VHDKGSVTVMLKNIAAGKYQMTVNKIGYQANDPYSRYLELGQPADLSRAAVAELKKLSSGQPVLKKLVAVTSGDFEMTMPLRENDVYLLTLKRQ